MVGQMTQLSPRGVPQLGWAERLIHSYSQNYVRTDLTFMGHVDGLKMR